MKISCIILYSKFYFDSIYDKFQKKFCILSVLIILYNMYIYYLTIYFNFITEYEISFIRLLDKLTNGTRIELNETGTSVYYNPGILNGGELEHDCSLQRGIGYYLEGIMILAPFCKIPIDIKLRGITNNSTGNNPI